MSSEIIWPFHPERGQHKDGHMRTLTCSSCPVVRSDGMLIEYCSLPVRPRLSAFSPCLYCSGIRPIPTKLPVSKYPRGNELSISTRMNRWKYLSYQYHCTAIKEGLD